MAKTKTLTFLFILFTIFSISTLTTTATKNHRFARALSPAKLGIKAEKLSHLHFYFHDTISGKNVTAVRVAEAPGTKTSPTIFGAVNVIDDPLTIKPELSSERVGSAQGIFAAASQSEFAFATTVNFVFTSGQFNGSTLSVLGRNSVFSNIRELPIVGGTGVFRFARGYAQAHTYSRENNGNAVVEYNVYVYHY